MNEKQKAVAGGGIEAFEKATGGKGGRRGEN